MGIIQNIKNTLFKGNRFLSSDDFGESETFRRLTGSDWNEANNLSAYGKSLYVYACVSKIAEKVGSVDFKLLKIINADGDTEEVKSHEALDLLYKWNPFFTKEEAIETDTINRKLTGDSYIYKVRNEQGKVVELWNIRPDLVTIQKSKENYIANYVVRVEDGTKEEVIPPEDIIHIKYPSPLNQYFGLSPLSPSGERINTEEYASKYQRDFFLNNARVDGTLETDAMLTKDQRAELLEGWNKYHKGVGKNSKTAVLDAGLKYNQISLSQREMDYIESMRATRDDILTAFKVPKPIVAVTDDVNRANAETAQEIFLSETIKPELNKLINKLNEELIIPEYGEEYYLTYEDPVPVNREVKLQELQAGVDKWITRNEARQDLGLEPLQGGDSLYVPISSIPLNKTATQQESKSFRLLHGRRFLKAKLSLKAQYKDFSESLKKSVKDEVVKEKKIKESSLFKDVGQRKAYYNYMMKNIDREIESLIRKIVAMKNEQKNEIIKELKKVKPKSTKDISKVFNKKEQNEKLKDWAIPVISDIFKRAGEDAMKLLSIDTIFNMEAKSNTKTKIAKLIATRAMFFATSVNDTTFDKLKEELSVGITAGEGVAKLTKRVNEVYLDFNDYRAERIARTETTFAVNEANLEAYKQVGSEGKEWIATLDDRVRDEHLLLDGEIVRVGETFSNGLQAPSDINCRCTIAPVFRIID